MRTFGHHKRFILALLIALLTTLQASNLHSQEEPNQEFKEELKNLLSTENHFFDQYDAQVWMKDMSIRLGKRAKHIPLKERLKILGLVHKHANAAGVDPQMILAIMEVESNFDHYALSVAYARGLMQIMPFWQKEIGKPEDDLFDIETNIKYGCYIYKLYLKYEKGNTTLALGRYNGSRGKMKYPRKVYNALKRRWAL